MCLIWPFSNFWTKSGILNHCGNPLESVNTCVNTQPSILPSTSYQGEVRRHTQTYWFEHENHRQKMTPFLAKKIGKCEKVLVEYISSNYFDKHCYVTEVKKMYRCESNNYKTWHFWNYLTTYKQLFYECQHRILWKVKVHLHFLLPF